MTSILDGYSRIEMESDTKYIHIWAAKACILSCILASCLPKARILSYLLGGITYWGTGTARHGQASIFGGVLPPGPTRFARQREAWSHTPNRRSADILRNYAFGFHIKTTSKSESSSLPLLRPSLTASRVSGEVQLCIATYSHISPYTAIYSHIQPYIAIFSHI